MAAGNSIIKIEFTVEEMGTISIALDQFVNVRNNQPTPGQFDLQKRLDRIYRSTHMLLQDRVIGLTRKL